MFRSGAALLAGLTFLPVSTSAEPIRTFDQAHVHVVVSSEPKRVEWEVVVPAALDAVWSAFTTSDGLATWVAPKATVDARVGGEWTARFPGAAPGGGTIIELAPKAFIAIAALAPEKFGTVRKDRTYALFTFAPASADTTRVHLTQTGWRDGAEWDSAMDYLAEGNAELLELLYQRFAKGPIQWSR